MHQYARGFRASEKNANICDAQTHTPIQHARFVLSGLAQTPTVSQHAK